MTSISWRLAPPWFIPDTTTLFAQLAAFRARREHFALVVDEYGALRGVVTLEDILEEIVGDIEDETWHRGPRHQGRADGSYIVDGTVTIRDLNRACGWRLPDDAAATIAGLVLEKHGASPRRASPSPSMASASRCWSASAIRSAS